MANLSLFFRPAHFPSESPNTTELSALQGTHSMAENKGIDFDLTFPKISKLPYLGSKRRARHDLLADLAVDMVGLQLDLDVKVEIVPLLAPLEMDQLRFD